MFKNILMPLMIVAGVLLGWRLSTAETSTPTRRPGAVLHLPAELPSATGYAIVNALPDIKFELPLCIATPPDERDRLFVVEKNGKIQVITHYTTKPQKSEFLDIAGMLRRRGAALVTQSEMGAWGMAFHPRYAQNGYFYATYGFSIQDGDKLRMFDRLSRFSVSKSDPNRADPDSERPIFTQLDLAPNHNGGDIHFGADGYLYWSNGDEGGGNDSFNNSRFIDKDFFAGIFRIDVDQRPGNLPPNPHVQKSTLFPSAFASGTYLVPADNPFIHVATHSGKPVDAAKLRTELWCTGLRNPWRFSFDPANGNMLIGNVGEGMWEQVDLGAAGGDYGWNYLEGSHDGPAHRDQPAAQHLIPPIFEYPHRRTGPNNPVIGNCIIGGFVYRGSQYSDLYGTYIFSDFGSRQIWGLKLVAGKWTPRLLAERNEDLAGFGPDPSNNDVLMCAHVAGKIMRLTRKGTTGTRPPPLLSETGAFADLATLRPASGLVAYKPNVSFWSDDATKTRWFSLPKADDTITYNRDGNWVFPTGTVWVKHFDMQMKHGDPTSTRRLETRFLVRTASGVYGLTYKWRADQTDADLVPESGQDEDLSIEVDGQATRQTWHYPSQSECITCHTLVAGYALGFNTRQLNGDLVNGEQAAGGKTSNQIQTLSDNGYFSHPVADVKSLPAFVNASDVTQPLEARVRSYLSVNCVQCHQPGGGATGLWDARPTTPLARTGLINGTLINTLGDPLNRWAVPGDPAHSVALQRLTVPGPHHMPPLATNKPDTSSIQLIADWIKQLRAAARH